MKPRKPLQRRTELRSTIPLERTSRLRSSGPVKAKRAPKTSAELQARLLVSARSRGRCELNLPTVCTGRATDWSHRIARGRGGKWSASNGMAACRECHEAITNTRGLRARIEELGYIVRTGADTREVPVVLHGRVLVLLDDDGSFVEVGEAA